MQNQIIGIRLPPDLIDKAEELTTQLQKTDVSDFGGTITRSAIRSTGESPGSNGSC